MNDYLNIAIDKEYFIRVDSLEDKNGCVVSFPRNIMLNKPAVSYTYLIEQNGVSLYNNSFELINKLECENFASRAVIIYDIFIKAFKLKIPVTLILCYSNNKLVGDFSVIKSLMKEVDNIEKEKILVSQLPKINDDTFIVDKSISSIFNEVKNRILDSGDILC